LAEESSGREELCLIRPTTGDVADQQNQNQEESHCQTSANSQMNGWSGWNLSQAGLPTESTCGVGPAVTQGAPTYRNAQCMGAFARARFRVHKVGHHRRAAIGPPVASGMGILCPYEVVLKNTIGKEEKEQAQASTLRLLAASRICRRAGRTVTPIRPGVPATATCSRQQEASKARTETMDPGARAGTGLAPKTILRPDSSSPGTIYPRRVGSE
jgi:hypothetical protein